MISSTRVSIENFSFPKDDLFNKSSILIHAADSWQSKFLKKCYLDWFRSIFKVLILSHHQFDFLHQNVNRKHNTCRQVFKLKNHCFLLFHQFSDSPKIPKKNNLIFFIGIHTHISTKVQVLSHLSGQHRKHSSFRGFLDGKIVELWSLHQCLDSPSVLHQCLEVSKKCYLSLIRTVFKLVFLSYNFEFLHHELKLKHNTCRRILGWKPLILFVVAESGLSKISEKSLINLLSRQTNSSSFCHR